MIEPQKAREYVKILQLTKTVNAQRQERERQEKMKGRDHARDRKGGREENFSSESPQIVES